MAPVEELVCPGGWGVVSVESGTLGFSVERVVKLGGSWEGEGWEPAVREVGSGARVGVATPAPADEEAGGRVDAADVAAESWSAVWWP